VKRNAKEMVVVLVYMDKININGNNLHEVKALKQHLNMKFDVKDLGHLCYFLGMEVAYFRKGLFISQRKYTLDLLKETRKLKVAPAQSPMNYNGNLLTKSPYYSIVIVY